MGGVAPATSGNTGTSGNDGDKKVDSKWIRNAEDVILNLNSTSEDIMNIAKDVKGDWGKQMLVQKLMSDRSQIAGMFTNILRAMSDTAQQIIRNIR